jgi:hypothetical protein
VRIIEGITKAADNFRRTLIGTSNLFRLMQTEKDALYCFISKPASARTAQLCCFRSIRKKTFAGWSVCFDSAAL